MGFINKIFAICGMFAPILLLVSVLVAVSVAGSSFSWTRNALSDLGIQADAGPIFNGGLMAAAALMVVFTIGMLINLRKSVLGMITSVFLLLESIALFGIGVFTEADIGMHMAFAAGFFGLAAITRILFGIYFLKVKPRLLGLLSIILLVLAVLSWGVAFIYVGIAIPEFASVVFAYLFIFIISVRMLWQDLNR